MSLRISIIMFTGPILTTLKLAIITTFILIMIATPLSWWLAKTRSKLKPFIESFCSLPLILPPSVLGFYLLLVLAPNGPLGKAAHILNLGPLVFTFKGLVIGSIIYSLPFVVRPIQNSFEQIDQEYLDAASLLGASKWDQFKTIILPLSFPGFLTASILGMAHTIGEFGVVLMIGGNIPGKTRVLSIAIYDHVENLEYHQAHILSGGLLITSFILLLFVYTFNKNFSFLGKQ